MPEKTAFIFPGQGSQSVGMGRDLADKFPEAREIFRQMDDICGKSISKLCFEGPIEDLTITINLQPAITAVNLACFAALNGAGISPFISAGHSVGEYSALASSGVISPYDALRLIKRRGELMHRESLANPGVMVALLGMEINSVEDIVARARGKEILSIAVHNSAHQIVISGEELPVSRAVDLVKEQGGKAIPLKVSGAWHCALMKNAVDDFRDFMEGIPFTRPKTTILFNATAETEDEPEKIKDLMAQQLINPVKWYDIVLRMLDDGVDAFVEVGPKKVLTGLINKIIPKENGVDVYNVENLPSLNEFLEAVK